MNGGGCGFEVPLHIALCGWVAVEFGVIVDEGKILSLFVCVLGFHCVSKRSVTMESIKISQWVGRDGILHLNIPIDMTDRDVEAVVIYQPVQALTSVEPSLESLYGICADDPIVLDDRGVSEVLDDELAGAFD